ncbi:MAG: hypothetical protein R3224_10460, partial [Balneolaceae bacterium]|nr:hypothetical protein [Balneolaceae bacterium]
LLISMSLGFSTVHNHEYLQYSSDDRQAVEHTITTDSSLCPICGYLFHADRTPDRTARTLMRVDTLLPISAAAIFDNDLVLCNRMRGPPFNA